MANMSAIITGKLMPPPKNLAIGELSTAGAAVWANTSIMNMPLPFAVRAVSPASRRRRPERVPAREPVEELRSERREASFQHRRARAADERDHVVHGVHRGEAHAEQLAGDDQVAEVGARVLAARRAVAIRIQRALVLRVGRVAHHEAASAE